ncbi:hypothetical protein XHC_0319 [Xanthomonas hortorum pv. carotae str. M081]|nr:hypothetical protein XHC_0319 [Xanthomonas hortorum pv. carotae str. M081]
MRHGNSQIDVVAAMLGAQAAVENRQGCQFTIAVAAMLGAGA